MCLSSIGGELRNINIDSAIIYLEKSIQLSKELDNSFLLYRSSAMLTRAYFSKNDFKRSKDLALAFINTENSYVGDDIYYDIDIPSIKIADGLLPYEVISFTNNELLVSMNTENLTLYDKICQMKTLQEIVMSLNNLTKLDISLKENNIIYKYKNDSSIIEVIETINL